MGTERGQYSKERCRKVGTAGSLMFATTDCLQSCHTSISSTVSVARYMLTRPSCLPISLQLANDGCLPRSLGFLAKRGVVRYLKIHPGLLPIQFRHAENVTSKSALTFFLIRCSMKFIIYLLSHNLRPNLLPAGNQLHMAPHTFNPLSPRLLQRGHQHLNHLHHH